MRYLFKGVRHEIRPIRMRYLIKVAVFIYERRDERTENFFTVGSTTQNSVVWSRSPLFSPLVLCKVKAGKNTLQRYNSTVPKIVHYEAGPIAHVDIILISSRS